MLLFPFIGQGNSKLRLAWSHPINQPENCHWNPCSGLNRFSDCPHHWNIWVPSRCTWGEAGHVHAGWDKHLPVHPAPFPASWTPAISRWNVATFTPPWAWMYEPHHRLGWKLNPPHPNSALWLPGCSLVMGHGQSRCESISESRQTSPYSRSSFIICSALQNISSCFSSHRDMETVQKCVGYLLMAPWRRNLEDDT